MPEKLYTPGTKKRIVKLDLPVILVTLVVIVLTAATGPGTLRRGDIKTVERTEMIAAPASVNGPGSVLPPSREGGTWRPGAGVTAYRDTMSYVSGSSSTGISISEGFGTGLVAYLSPLDLSGGRKTSLWIKSGADIGDDYLALVLRGEAGITVVTQPVPGNALDGRTWHKLTLNLSEIPESYDAIKSVALVAAADPGPLEVWLDLFETRSTARQAVPPATGASGGSVLNISKNVQNT